MIRICLGVATMLAVLQIMGCRRPTLPQVVVASSFIFDGTVREAGVSLMPEIVKPGPEIYVVRVDKVYSQPSFHEFSGKEITFKNTGTSRLQPKESFLFLTNPLAYGQTLAVRGQVRRGSPDSTRTVGRREDLLIEDRIERADLIVQGRVLEVLLGPGKAVPQSEHDPVWQTAVVQVDAYAKQRPSEDKIKLYFPTSDDIAWFRSPRFSPKDSGAFLIQLHPLDRARKELPQYTALHPLDFFPADRIPETVRERLKPIGAKARGTPQRPEVPKRDDQGRRPAAK